jgi:hypothetical protein
MLRHARFSGKASRLPALATDCVRQHRDLPGGIESNSTSAAVKNQSVFMLFFVFARPNGTTPSRAEGIASKRGYHDVASARSETGGGGLRRAFITAHIPGECTIA